MEPLMQPQAWSPRRSELLTWFRSNAPALADAYEGALRLLALPTFPGRVHFIAHAVRDIGNRLVFVLDPQLRTSQVQYANQLDLIEPLWPNIQDLEETDEQAVRDTVSIDYKLAARIDSLIAAHRDSRRNPSNLDLLFRYLMRSEPSRADVNRRVIRDFKMNWQYFMKLAHLRDVPTEFEEAELQARFDTFEGILHSFVGDFFTGARELDAILLQANQ